MTAARRNGRVWASRSSRTRASPWTISRRLPSGSLNILWMWVDGADGIQVLLLRLVDGGLALREDADHPVAGAGLVDQADGGLARHRQRHERIGKQDRVAKRQDRQLGRDLRAAAHRRRPLRRRRVSSRSLIVIAHLVQTKKSGNRVIGRPITRLPDVEDYPIRAQPCMSTKSEAAPRRWAIRRSRCCATSRASSQSLQRTANGSARSRCSAISSPHSKQ